MACRHYFALPFSFCFWSLFVFYGSPLRSLRGGGLPTPHYLSPLKLPPRLGARSTPSVPTKLCLPRRVRERVLGGLFLRFLESFFGSKVLFFFIRDAWTLLGPLVRTQEHIFARRISQYSS